MKKKFSSSGTSNRNVSTSLNSSSSKMSELDEDKNSRKTRTYGRITSGVGSLTHPGSFGTG